MRAGLPPLPGRTVHPRLSAEVRDGETAGLSLPLGLFNEGSNIHNGGVYAQKCASSSAMMHMAFEQHIAHPCAMVRDQQDQQESQRAFIRRAMEVTGLDATNLARRAGFAPSTLNRFLNNPQVNHLLSGKTIAAISAVSGVPVPGSVAESVAPVGGVAREHGEDLSAPSTVDASVYDEAVKTVRNVFSAAGINNCVEEAKAVAHVYHQLMQAKYRH